MAHHSVSGSANIEKPPCPSNLRLPSSDLGQARIGSSKRRFRNSLLPATASPPSCLAYMPTRTTVVSTLTHQCSFCWLCPHTLCLLFESSLYLSTCRDALRGYFLRLSCPETRSTTTGAVDELQQPLTLLCVLHNRRITSCKEHLGTQFGTARKTLKMYAMYAM